MWPVFEVNYNLSVPCSLQPPLFRLSTVSARAALGTLNAEVLETVDERGSGRVNGYGPHRYETRLHYYRTFLGLSSTGSA